MSLSGWDGRVLINKCTLVSVHFILYPQFFNSANLWCDLQRETLFYNAETRTSKIDPRMFLGHHHVEFDITIYDVYFSFYLFYNSVSKKFSTLTPIYVGVSRSKVMCVNAWQQHMVNEGINIHWSLGTKSESTRSNMITSRPRSKCYLMECPCTIDVHTLYLLVALDSLTYKVCVKVYHCINSDSFSAFASTHHL